MRTFPTDALSLVALVVVACGQDQPRGDPLKGGAPPTPRADGLPSGHPPLTPQLPPGHPAPDAPTQPAPPLTPPQAPQAAPFAWTKPDGWTEKAPANAMRLTQFTLPGAWPDGRPVECVVFTAMGGGVTGNLERWYGQITQADGSPSSKAARTEERKNGDLTITRMQVRGKFGDTMSGAGGEDAIMLGAVIQAKPGDTSVYTVKCVGPASVIEPEIQNFDRFLGSIQTKPDPAK